MQISGVIIKQKGVHAPLSQHPPLFSCIAIEIEILRCHYGLSVQEKRSVSINIICVVGANNLISEQQ